jgi:hypothetical protein
MYHFGGKLQLPLPPRRRKAKFLRILRQIVFSMIAKEKEEDEKDTKKNGTESGRYDFDT